MVDFGKAKAPASCASPIYRRTQKNGFGGAIWNLKIFSGIEDSAPQLRLGPPTAADWNGRERQNNGDV